jgi:hypothetical protein
MLLPVMIQSTGISSATGSVLVEVAARSGVEAERVSERFDATADATDVETGTIPSVGTSRAAAVGVGRSFFDTIA